MTRSKLIQQLADVYPEPGLVRGDFERVVHRMFREISDALSRGDRVELRDFGCFSVRPRVAHVSRNPRTGAYVAVGRRHHPHFKTGKRLFKRLNQF